MAGKPLIQMADAVKTFLLFYFVLFFLTEISGQKHKKENKRKQNGKTNFIPASGCDHCSASNN
jgi:hypothetical protein